MPQPVVPPLPSARLRTVADWVVVGGIGVILVWTTLCLGGYLAATLVFSAPAVFALGAIATATWLALPPAARPRLNLAALLPLPFLVYALAGVWGWAPARWLAWREWLLWFQMWWIFVLVLHFGGGRRHVQVLIGVVAALGVVGVGMAFYQRFSDPDWMMLGRTQLPAFHSRSSGMFGIPNSLAGLLELLIPPCLVLLFSRSLKPAGKIVAAWLAALFIFAIALTGSRGGWIGLGLALLAWPALAVRGWRSKLIGLAAATVLLAACIAGLYRASDTARQRLLPLLEGQGESSRPILWQAAVEIWRDHPWWGAGPASYNVVFERYRPRGFQDEPQWTHNDYLNILSDHGTIGFLLWFGAAVGLMALGWSDYRRRRRIAEPGAGWLGSAKWRLGLWLGLLAFGLHLAVDFHLRIPALAYLVAIVLALLVREIAFPIRELRSAAAWTVGVMAIATAAAAAWIAVPIYRAEGLRSEARRAIDRYARQPRGDLEEILTASRRDLAEAVRIDPANGQAWADVAYATGLNRQGTDRPGIGRFAELAADRALELCPVNAEFWTRKGMALAAELRVAEAADCFRRATQLAPNSAVTWFIYARDLQPFSERRGEAARALETCLTLDPYFPAVDSLRQQLPPVAN